MRFLANGPSIPDDLLIARDAGDVIFFCGAGVSRHCANLPDFLTLGGSVIDLLGAGEKTVAKKLFRRIRELDPIDGVGGLIATDRIFSLLEREFEQRDVQTAVARAIKPADAPDLSANKTLIDLSRGRDGTVRLVTTNFDLLFEAVAPDIPRFGPPVLPDPRSASFGGIIHLHGRVNSDYSGPRDREFIVSSADFGRAYLSDGWATRFMQSLLARFQIVFVGYGADDPPVQYLLEALSLHAGTRSRLFAFQPGSNADDAALWEHRGVRAIPFDNSQGYAPLWDTLAAWAERARDIDGWYARLLETASAGPAALAPHVRGQIAHVVSTRDGARRVGIADTPIPASWLLAFDPRQRFGKPGRLDLLGGSGRTIDPFELLALDLDTPPQPTDEDEPLFDRTVPGGMWSAFAPTRHDQEDAIEANLTDFCGGRANLAGPLSPRLNHLGTWFHRIAHQPIALWWAAASGPFHSRIVGAIDASLRQDPNRWPDDIRRGWRFLITCWSDQRIEPDRGYFELTQRIAREGWSESRVRDYASLFQPRLKVGRRFDVPHPLSWTESERPDPLLSFDVEYPHPYELLHIPDQQLAYAITRFRENLDFARSVEAEISDDDLVYISTTRADDGAEPINFDSFGLTGPIALFLQLLERLVALAPNRARAEIASWPTDDCHVFARLRIWAASSPVMEPVEAANILLGFSDGVFWGSIHRRELLYAIRDRWLDFSGADRERFEQRLRNTTYPWSDPTLGGKACMGAHYRLDYLYWLKSQGLTFSFDVMAEMATLRPIAQDWSERSGKEVADSDAPVIRGIDTDTDPRVLDDVPVDELIERARQEEHSKFIDYVECHPFQGLAQKRPVRALAALTRATRKGDVPLSFWSDFLLAEPRRTDPARLSCLIGGRLASFSPSALSAIARPIAEWLQRLGERMFSDVAPVLDRLWEPLLAALRLSDDDRKHRVDSSWANDALNRPAGKLASLLMKDPSTKGRDLGQGFPDAWLHRHEQLLALPGDMRRHALVIVGFQINWLFAIAPEWTTVHLLDVVENKGDDGDALWDGILWSARVPSRTLLERIKPGLLARATSPKDRRDQVNVIGGFLLIGWGGDPDAEPPEQLVTSVELRDILVEGDQDLRGQVLRHLERLSAANDKWRTRLIQFLTEVWPYHRAVRTPEMSTHLVALALASGDLFPQVVQTVFKRLVPVRGGMLQTCALSAEAEPPAQLYPAAMLDLLWAILAEDATLWPYKIEEVLEIIAGAPQTQGDPRLSELRRRGAGR